MYETIKTSVEDGIFFLTLNRPEALNTIVPPMPDEFRAAIEEATRDERRQGHRRSRQRPGLLCRLQLRRWLPPLGRLDRQ